MIDSNPSEIKPTKQPDTDKPKFIDLITPLAEVKELLRQIVATMPAQKEYLEMQKALSEVAELLKKSSDTDAMLRRMDAEWRVVTTRFIQSLEETQKEKLEFRKIYTEVLGKEMRLITEIRDEVHKNDERLLKQVMSMAGHLANIPTLSWRERAKQYGVQLGITLVLLSAVVGVYHLAGFVVRLF